MKTISKDWLANVIERAEQQMEYGQTDFAHQILRAASDRIKASRLGSEAQAEARADFEDEIRRSL